MYYTLLADLVVLVHALFVLFVALGGLLVFWRPKVAWLHLPAVAWGVGIEVGGCICPLTYLENDLRRLGGAHGYGGSFIERYLEPLLYPIGLTHQSQYLFALAALVVNSAVYALCWRRYRRRHDFNGNAAEHTRHEDG